MIEALALFVALFVLLFGGLTVGALRASDREAGQVDARPAVRR
ncbi:hypothetical protein DFR52_101629 [Hoeflea marina]|uniref:Uncharacterized protein n=1 Tax=Hoeflea marina TaxID=274592 RepID=A0A317PWS9_9HYPH|nr:hypothetical protein [Hoeflea marina]PWW03940.1 hypothetical protein DFR52_101629 [Hoeflea marina]